jgi:glycosyltransferase involved in cell wall biosynthesis
MTTPRVVVLRGTAANPWDLRPWEAVRASGAADVSVVVPPDNDYDVSSLSLPKIAVRTAGGVLPEKLPARGLALKAVGQRHLGLADALRGADIVHAAELGTWFSWQAARLKPKLGYKLALTVWETLPFIDAYRNVRTRRYRRDVLAAADLLLPTTERAREALLLEGADPDKIVVCPPGIDVERFATARTARPPADGSHLLLSAARMVWEKGHQDVLRALAVLRRRGRDDVRALLIGDGPERERLEGVVADLGLGDRVQLRASVPYAEMPALYAQASSLVLASIPIWSWEEQFGMVLAEAMGAHLPIVTTRSGAIPEVVGDDATLVAPGDWLELADALDAGPLAAAPGTRRAPDPARLERFSVPAAARRLIDAYMSLAARA